MTFLQLNHDLKVVRVVMKEKTSELIKGNGARDFLEALFFIKQSHLVLLEVT